MYSATLRRVVEPNLWSVGAVLEGKGALEGHVATRSLARGTCGRCGSVDTLLAGPGTEIPSRAGGGAAGTAAGASSRRRHLSCTVARAPSSAEGWNARYALRAAGSWCVVARWDGFWVAVGGRTRGGFKN